jgi:manganese transport protein
VVLSLQLSFAVIPLIHFTSDRRNMGEFATPLWGQVLAWGSASIIVGLNAKLVYDKVDEWVGLAAESGRSLGPVPLSWVVGGALYTIALSALALLVWVTIKPLVRPAAPWKPEPPVELDWSDALRPRTLDRVGVALERGAGDAEILNRALSLAEPGRTELVILHVVDSTMTRVYGPETADRETDADERYLAEIVQVLQDKGYDARPVLLYGPDRAGLLIHRLKEEPVDLLVAGSHGHGPVRDMMFGQTVDKVRHGLSIPMLVARPDPNSRKGEDA